MFLDSLSIILEGSRKPNIPYEIRDDHCDAVNEDLILGYLLWRSWMCLRY